MGYRAEFHVLPLLHMIRDALCGGSFPSCAGLAKCRALDCGDHRLPRVIAHMKLMLVIRPGASHQSVSVSSLRTSVLRETLFDDRVEAAALTCEFACGFVTSA